MTVTFYKGVMYIHSEYNTAAKQKKLPEAVKKAIQKDKYKEPIIEE